MASSSSSSMASSTISSSSQICPFSILSDDLLLNILLKLEADPSDWARLSCVCSRFSSLIHHVCYKAKCLLSCPPELTAAANSWTSLHKLSICCPGLLHSGVLFENSDFGLERDIGPDHHYCRPTSLPPAQTAPPTALPSDAPDCPWSLFDDLYFDTIYDISEAHIPQNATTAASPPPPAEYEFSKKRKSEPDVGVGPHLAANPWNLSREQGRKLLASRFSADPLYLCDFPGCVHAEEKRSYMVFRGVFKDFKRTRVWRAINDGKRRAIDLDCAYCECRETWDLHAAFCLRRVFGFHDDGEPVVRAYVCVNGHVSGAWTERPMCT